MNTATASTIPSSVPASLDIPAGWKRKINASIWPKIIEITDGKAFLREAQAENRQRLELVIPSGAFDPATFILLGMHIMAFLRTRRIPKVSEWRYELLEGVPGSPDGIHVCIIVLATLPAKQVPADNPPESGSSESAPISLGLNGEDALGILVGAASLDDQIGTAAVEALAAAASNQ